MKKIVSLFLTLCMLLSLSFSFAEELKDTWTPDDYTAAADIRTETASDFTGKTVILHSNDVHGQIDGYALIAGLRTYFQDLGATVILADMGDFSQGDPAVNLSRGENAVEMMNAAKYDVATLGNHEFIYGYDQLTQNLSKATFSVLCANVRLEKTGELLYPATKMIETESGLKLGFFGLATPETVRKVNPALIKSLTFSQGDELYRDAQEAVDSLEGADLIIGLTHLGVDEESREAGYRSLDLYRNVKGIDLLLDGHSALTMTVCENGEPIQSAGTKFAAIGVVVIDNETKVIEDRYLLPTALGSKLFSFVPVDPDVRNVSDTIISYVDTIYGTAFATSEAELNGERNPGVRTEETNMGDLIAESMIWYVVKEGGLEQAEPNAVVGIVNGGCIRASIHVGDVTRNDINKVLPFGNTVSVTYVKGSELLEVLEASTFNSPEAFAGFPQTSGIEWTLDTTKPYDAGEVYIRDGQPTDYNAPASINRVTISKINGEPFDPEATYALVTNDYCAVGGDTYNVLANCSYTFDTGVAMDVALIGYIQDVLEGKIPADYANPKGNLTIIQ